MLLELLSGRLAGGALAVLVLDTDLSMATGPGGGKELPSVIEGPRDEAECGGVKLPAEAIRGGPLTGGALARPVSGPIGGPAEGPSEGLEVAERGALFGGGGVAFLALSSAPPFLLIHRLSSGS